MRNKIDGSLGTLEYSMFGGSVHFFDEESGAFGKTTGDRLENIYKIWESVELPDGYEIGEWGGVRKVKDEWIY